MNLQSLFEMSKTVVETVETVGAAVGATGPQKQEQATILLADKVNDVIDLPVYVEENTDEVLSLIVDLTVWSLNTLRSGWEASTPLQDVAAEADPADLEKIQIGLSNA